MSETRGQIGAKRAAAAPETLVQALLESSLDAVIAMDCEGRIAEFSLAAQKLFGRTREEVIGQDLASVIIPPFLRERHRAGIARSLRGSGRAPEGVRLETVGMCADGTEFPVEVSIRRIGTGSELLYVGSVRDLTARRQAELALARSEQLLSEAEVLAGAGSFETELATGEVRWSRNMYRLHGLEPGQVPPSLAQVLAEMDPRDRARADTVLQELRAGVRREFALRVRICPARRGDRLFELRGRVQRDDLGQAVRLLGTARDVTEEARARFTRDLLGYVVESTDDAVVTESPDGVILSWNRGAERLYGYTEQEAVGAPAGLIVPPRLIEEHLELTRRLFTGESVRHMETERHRKDGKAVFVSVTMSPVRDEDGRIVCAAVLARDVTERVRAEQRLRHLADHDPLTGLLNRRRFAEELARELSFASRSEMEAAVLSIDLDSFKQINDSAGHAAGDAVLQAVARTLRDSLRRYDVLARIGGDEFAALLPATAPEQAHAAAENLQAALKRCVIEIEGARFSPTASIGIATLSPGQDQTDEVVVNADLAMYAAKQQGRDRIVAFTPEQARRARAGAKLTWSARIQDALDNDGLRLHWQPIVELEGGRVSHGEVLLRMAGPDGLVAPEAFLPVAERLGLIHAIDRWVLRTTVRLLAGGQGPARMPLSVNLSVESICGDPDLLGLIERELDHHNVDPGRLILEVTETAAIANIGQARRFARDVRRLGCRIALDDFGIGFGSFYHLKHLPIDFLKIDREFIHGLAANDFDRHLVHGVVDIARELGVATVAEGVEGKAAVDLLRELGVGYAQGYHLGPPRSI